MGVSVLDFIRAHAERAPQHPALIQAGADGQTRTRSYRELLSQVDTVADRLRAAGVGAGERCGLVAGQGIGFVESALAILATDACVVPIPDDHGGEVLEAFAQRARLHHLCRIPGEGKALELRRYPDAQAVDGQGDREFRSLRPAYLRFTSGTTHRRKGVILGHAAILARLEAANRALEIGPSDRILWLLPMAHHFVVSILLYLRFGGTILLPAGSLARDVLGFADREGATVFYASPYHYNLLAKDPGDQALDGVRLAISTAEGLRPEVAERFLARFGFSLRQALGIIEVGLPVLDSEGRGTPGALGRPLPDYELWLRSETGEPAHDATAPERSAEICIRGPGLFDAYLEPWTLAREILEPDGFRTGDQGWLDDAGDLHLAGRRANRINMAGMKFFGEEVEAVLDIHPDIRRSRVFARTHPHLGEIPVAEIELEDGVEPPDRKALSRFCRERLPGYKIPREFKVAELLPLTSTGKLERAPGVEGER
jgi:long-chain acyl-CoA synthetase